MRYSLNNIIFLDIETVSQYPVYEDVPEEWKTLWEKKAEVLLRNRVDETADSIYSRAAIYAEFGKIVCISCGFIQQDGEKRSLNIKSFCNNNEAVLLAEFSSMLHKLKPADNHFLCGHNAREFDFPYLCRRMIVNGVTLPPILNISGKKPWEVCHLDTMELWKFGDFKSYTSLNLLAHTLGVPTSKDDIDGSMVGQVYWGDKDLPRIVTYCQKDVVTLTQVFLRMQGEPIIPAENIIYRPLST